MLKFEDESACRRLDDNEGSMGQDFRWLLREKNCRDRVSNYEISEALKEYCEWSDWRNFAELAQKEDITEAERVELNEMLATYKKRFSWRKFLDF
jgi:hypothetical protein